jgi:energy-coupling factor transport system permease protein
MLKITYEGKGLPKELAGYMIIFLIMSLMNPLFVHRGSTPLFFLNGKAITLEAFVYGVFSSLRLTAALIWCRSFSLIMTSDRVYCLTGKLSPKITAMLTMAVRFIPDMLEQGRKISVYSKASGKYSSELKRRLGVFSALITWSIESGVQTADSMKARGFELGGRTSYSRYRYSWEDYVLIALSISADTAAFLLSSYTGVEYYPELRSETKLSALAAASAASASAYIFPAAFTLIIKKRRGKRR